MRKYLILILFLTPAIVFPQVNSVGHSPSDFEWKYVGNQGFSPGEADYISSAFNSSGQLFVSFLDYDYGSFATVMTFDGSSWNLAGMRGFSQEDVWETSIAISPTENQPYVAFSPHDIHGIVKPARVIKFSGSNWANVGIPYFSAGKTAFINLVFNSSGQPFVAYRDDSNSYKATVMKFDGTNWGNVGNPGFSQDKAYFTTLAFNTVNNQPYIAFEDYGNSQKVTVMRFDGNSWIPVGPEGFSAGSSYFISLAINSSGIPNVAFLDGADSAKATVMKFDSVYTGIQAPLEADFSVFPNPSNGEITIGKSKSEPILLTHIEIFDYSGKLISCFEGPVKDKLNLTFLPNGLYLLSAFNRDSRYTFKFAVFHNN